MKKWIIILLVLILVVLVGTWPLSILAIVFDWIGAALRWLANVLDFFNWNGLV